MSLDDHEKAMCCLVAHYLNATWSEHDDGSRNEMYDADLVGPDGTLQSLEITRVAQQSEFNLAANLDEEPIEVPSAAHDWIIFYPLMTKTRKLKKYALRLVQMCEQQGVAHATDLRELQAFDPDAPSVDAAVNWYCRHGMDVTLSRVAPRRESAAKLFFTPSGYGGSADGSLDPIDEWLCTQVDEAWLVDNASKLSHDPDAAQRRHLAVTLHPSAVPGDVMWALHHADRVSAGSEFHAPYDLTDLWLAELGAPKVAHWSDTHGWTLYSR